MSVIISIDPSCNSSAICVLPIDSNTPLSYECIIPQTTDYSRLYYNHSRFSAIFNNYVDIQCISFEKQVPEMRYNNNAKYILDLAENIGIMKLAILDRIKHSPNILVLGIPPGDIKRFATGNYRASKEDMISKISGTHIKRIRREIPEGSIDDIADAYHLARYTKELIKGGNYSDFIYYERKTSTEE